MILHGDRRFDPETGLTVGADVGGANDATKIKSSMSVKPLLTGHGSGLYAP